MAKPRFVVNFTEGEITKGLVLKVEDTLTGRLRLITHDAAEASSLAAALNDGRWADAERIEREGE